MKLQRTLRFDIRPCLGQAVCALTSLVALAALTACQSAAPSRPQALPPPVQAIKIEPAAPLPQAPPQPETSPVARIPVAAAPTLATKATPKPSNASNAKAYRADAAAHLYELNKHRIYAGRLPPNLYAIGVLDVELNARGQVLGLKWQRAPSHAPEVVQEIERTVREAAPYPMLQRMRQVTYTDVWLWHRSGNFQLDTLTEGQD